MNPGRNCRCPVCNANVDQVGETLPMGQIGEIVRGVKEECQWLQDWLQWNNETIASRRASHQFSRTGVSSATTSPLMDPRTASPQFKGDRAARRATIHTVATDSPTLVPSSASLRQSPKLAQNRNIKAPPSLKLPPASIDLEEAKPNLLRIDTVSTVGKESGYFSTGAHPSEGYPSPREVGQDHLESPKSPSHGFFPKFSSPAEKLNFDAQEAGANTNKDSPLKHTLSARKVSTSFPHSHASPYGTIAPTHDGTKPRPDEELPLIQHATSSATSRSSIASFESTQSTARDTVRRFSTASTDPVGPATRADTHAPLSPSPLSPSPLSPSPFSPSVSPSLKGFRVKTSTRVQVGKKGTYQATAISDTCGSIALINKSDFVIFTVPVRGSDEMVRMVCCGFNDGRFGLTPQTADRFLNDPRAIKPTYVRAVMTDQILCIACAENCIDVHDSRTGERLGTLEFPQRRCWTMAMAPGGKVLAVGMETGEMLLYDAGDAGNFITTPTLIPPPTARSVNAIAFSPDSTYMSMCTSDNIIRTYRLESNVPTLLGIFDRKLDARTCRDPYYGVTGLALYLLCYSDVVHPIPRHCLLYRMPPTRIPSSLKTLHPPPQNIK
jgi:WD40 repeat protein